MKEITKQKTITEVIGYEAEDGTQFSSKVECEKYENSALNAIRGMFRKLMVSEPFSENCIWEHYGYGSDEYMMCVVDIKTEDDLKVAIMYQNEVDPTATKKFDTDMIGKKILVDLGYNNGWGDPQCIIMGSIPDLVKEFKKTLEFWFTYEDERKVS